MDMMRVVNGALSRGYDVFFNIANKNRDRKRVKV